MNLSKYILPVRPDIIREIGKRGVKELKKDETGTVKKHINKTGTSSFGWGTVDDTIPVNKKELKDIKRTLDAIINQIDSGMSPLECAADTPNGKRAAPIHVPEEIPQSEPQKKVRVSNMFEEWYNYCQQNFEAGSIGFIPECFHDRGMPPMDELLQTNIGQSVMNFSTFIKAVF